VLEEGEAWAHHELARRDEHAPGEREDKPAIDVRRERPDK
jgi:hypothetical protein